MACQGFSQLFSIEPQSTVESDKNPIPTRSISMEQKFGRIRLDLNPTYPYKFKVRLPNLHILSRTNMRYISSIWQPGLICHLEY